MVYCILLSVDGDNATYAIGSLINDITGKMVLNHKKSEYSIINQPNNEAVYDHFVTRMLSKYKKELDRGIFPKEMAYEI